MTIETKSCYSRAEIDCNSSIEFCSKVIRQLKHTLSLLQI